MESIEFSILIACFNNGMFVDNAILSALRQDYINFEIIVCDDCSTDNSWDVICKYSIDKRVTILKNTKNEGVGFTKNKLIQNSRGKFFGFLDADDYLPQNCLINVVGYFQKNTSLVYTDSSSINLNGEIIQEKGRSKKIISSLFLESFKFPIFHFVAFNREKYNLTEGIDISFRTAEDIDLWLKMEEVGSLKYVDKSLYFYRIHSNGISQFEGDIEKYLINQFSHYRALLNCSIRRNLDLDLQFINHIKRKVEFKREYKIFKFIKKCKNYVGIFKHLVYNSNSRT